MEAIIVVNHDKNKEIEKNNFGLSFFFAHWSFQMSFFLPFFPGHYVVTHHSWNLNLWEWEIKGSRVITEVKVIKGGDEMRFMPSRSVLRSCLWTRQPANWNSIVGIQGRSGSHLSSHLFNLTHRRTVPLSAPFQKKKRTPPHGNNSTSSPFTPEVLPITRCPLYPSFREIRPIKAAQIVMASLHASHLRLESNSRFTSKEPHGQALTVHFVIQTNVWVSRLRGSNRTGSRCRRWETSGGLISTQWQSCLVAEDTMWERTAGNANKDKQNNHF